jgi:hypothetical protein|tara:strand:- start:119 stop:532 length:414 start_codon:yes stop_codon:yes gene_type:complete
MKNNLKYIYEALGKTESLRIAEFLVNHYSRKIPPGVKIVETNFSDKSLKGDYDVDRNKIRIRTSYSKKSDFIISVLHEIRHAMDAKDKGKNQYKKEYEMEMNTQIALGKDRYDDNKFEIEAEKWAQKEYRKRWKGDF